jgi:hypothetical protein
MRIAGSGAVLPDPAKNPTKKAASTGQLLPFAFLQMGGPDRDRADGHFHAMQKKDTTSRRRCCIYEPGQSAKAESEQYGDVSTL